jgi:hypothetical protein
VFARVEGATPMHPVVGPPSPVRLLPEQVDGLAAEARSGGGVTGAELDDLVVMPRRAPPFSYLVAAWVSGYDSAEATQARRVMGGGDAHDWTHPADIVFPNLVLVLFVSDIGRDGAADGAPPTGGIRVAGTAAERGLATGGEDGLLLGPPGAAVGGTVCASLSGWLNGVLNSLFESIKLNSGSVPSIFEVIWNAAVDLAKGVVGGLIAALTAPVVAALKVGIAIVGTLAIAASFLKPWTVDVIPSPVTDHFAHPGEPDHEGTFTATVDTNGSDEWSQTIKDCASLADVTLPDPSAPGKPVEWKAKSLAPISVASVLKKDAKVGDDLTARLEYRTAREDANDPGGDLLHGSLLVTARVKRLTEAEMQNMLDTMIFSGVAGEIVAKLLGPVISGAKTKLAKLMTVNGSAVLAIDYHVGEETPPTTTPPTTAPTQPCHVGSWRVDSGGWRAWLAGLLPSSEGMTIQVDAPTGTMTRTHTANGRFTLAAEQFETHVRMLQRNAPFGNDITIDVFVTIDGTVSARYVAKAAGDKLDVTYLADGADMSTFAFTTEVLINGNEAPGGAPLPIDSPGNVVGDTRTFTCTGDTLVEAHPVQGTINWNRIPA